MKRMSASLDGIIWLDVEIHACKGYSYNANELDTKTMSMGFFTLRFSTFGEQDEDNDVRE